MLLITFHHKIANAWRRNLVDACSMRLHPIIKIDELLINELANHLDYAIFRLKHHIPIRNPYLNTIRKRYRLIYSVVENHIDFLEKQIHESIPAEEIGYISMYFLSALERLYAKEDTSLKAIIANDGVRDSKFSFEIPPAGGISTLCASRKSSTTSMD